MSETKERSGIFKFFYIFLSIITFPIFAILFVLRHPLWVLFILVLLAGGMVYWPMSQHNVELSGVVDWYKNKYQTTKIDIAKKAIEEGKSGYVPQAVLDEMKKIEEEAKEAALPKGENYNAKVVRDQKSEDLKATMKQRGGFKKKVEEKVIEAEEPMVKEDTEENSELEVMMPKVGGVSALLPASQDKENTSAEEVLDEAATGDTKPEVDLDFGEDAEEPKDNVQPTPKETAPQKTSTDDEDEMDLF